VGRVLPALGDQHGTQWNYKHGSVKEIQSSSDGWKSLPLGLFFDTAGKPTPPSADCLIFTSHVQSHRLTEAPRQISGLVYKVMKGSY
jgi:hypothetical protein